MVDGEAARVTVVNPVEVVTNKAAPMVRAVSKVALVNGRRFDKKLSLSRKPSFFYSIGWTTGIQNSDTGMEEFFKTVTAEERDFT